jgi:hypothetical protein
MSVYFIACIIVASLFHSVVALGVNHKCVCVWGGGITWIPPCHLESCKEGGGEGGGIPGCHSLDINFTLQQDV